MHNEGIYCMYIKTEYLRIDKKLTISRIKNTKLAPSRIIGS